MKPDDHPASEQRPTHIPARKPYEKPRLELYGDLTEISQAVVGSMAADGAGHPNRHFTS